MDSQMIEMKVRYIIPVLIAAAIIAASGCQTTRQGSKTYTRSEAQRPMHVTYGTVVSVANVTIEAEETGAGTVVGGVAGGVAGSTIGGGDGRKLATVAGVLLGAAVGSKAEKEMFTKDALEIEVRQDDGQVIVVVQEKDDVFNVGDRVRIVEASYGRLRVRH